MKIKEYFKNIFFPRTLTCSCCGRESFTGGILCERCLEKAERNDGFICDHCGVKTVAGEAYCPRCKNKLTSFDKARSAFVYGEVTSLLVQKLKYGGEKYLAEEFAKELYRLFVVSVSHADGIVCVPMSGKREKSRGYNQSKLIAEALAKLSSVPFLDVTVKKKETESQVGKNYGERRKNLEGSFGVKNKSEVKGKRLVIADDVTTTGSTAEVLAAALKRAGAEEVFVLTYASVSKANNAESKEEKHEENENGDLPTADKNENDNLSITGENL